MTNFNIMEDGLLVAKDSTAMAVGEKVKLSVNKGPDHESPPKEHDTVSPHIKLSVWVFFLFC